MAGLSKMNESEEQLRLRKLTAETELAERQLEQDKKAEQARAAQIEIEAYEREFGWPTPKSRWKPYTRRFMRGSRGK